VQGFGSIFQIGRPGAFLSLPKGLLYLILSALYMGSLNLSLMLAMGQPAQGQSAAPAWMQLFPLILLVVVFYVALIRPQQKKAKQHAEMLKGLKANDRVVTSSGIVGIVISVKEGTVTLRSADAKLELVKSAITEIRERGGDSTPS
jgi:preprotein translocase subunit YajC